jgi:threonylcarbamoyladenosine tRNA methylthiotransferase MtaB
MRRRYKREVYEERVAIIKEVMPHACIGVDVIVGFPGETEQHFQETYEFLHGLDVSYFHVFTYSERPDTVAIELPDPVPMNIRKDRNQQLRNLSMKKQNFFREQFVGQTRKVLWEGQDKEGMIEGFTDNYLKLRCAYDAEKVNQILPSLID